MVAEVHLLDNTGGSYVQLPDLSSDMAGFDTG